MSYGKFYVEEYSDSHLALRKNDAYVNAEACQIDGMEFLCFVTKESAWFAYLNEDGEYGEMLGNSFLNILGA